MPGPAKDPYADFADPIEEPASPAGAPSRAVPAQSGVGPGNDPYAGVADQVGDAPLVDPTTVTVQGFADELPPDLASKLGPQDHAEYLALARDRSTTPRQLEDWFAKHGWVLHNAEDIIADRRKGKGVSKGVVYQPPVITDQGGGFAAGVRGLGDTLTVGLLDELGALADTLGGTRGRENVESSDRSFGDIYRHNLDVNRATLHADEATHPAYRIAGQIIGGLAIPVGLEGVGLKAGTEVLRSGGTMAEARLAAAAAVRTRLTTSGGAYGALHGAGAAEGGVGDRAAGAALEGTEGALSGAGLGLAGELAVPRLAARAVEARSAPLTDSQQMVAAADRLGIEPFAPDVGGAGVRRLTSATAQSITGVQPLAAAASRVGSGARAVRDRIAGAFGDALHPEAAGQDALSGAQKYIALSRNQARAYYATAEKAAAGVKIAPNKALAAVHQNIAELSETPGGAPGLASLKGIADELSRGPVTVAGIRNMRTVLRDQFRKDGLLGSDIERRVNQVVDAAAEDVRDGLRAAGLSDASVAFAKGDAAWRTRASTIDNVLKPIIGTRDSPKSGEQIIKTLTADLQGNNARAVRFLSALPATEQGNLRASIIGALGRTTAGAAGADGDGFSLAAFLTHWNKIGETAKAAYFGNEGRAALNDLARIAQGSKEAQRFSNHSNTAGGVIGNFLFTSLGQGIGGAKTAGATLVAPYAMGRLLASPRFARWLVRAPRTALSDSAYIERLSRIAKAEPGIANEVLDLQRRLAAALTESAPLAAEQKNEVGQVPPEQ